MQTLGQVDTTAALLHKTAAAASAYLSQHNAKPRTRELPRGVEPSAAALAALKTDPNVNARQLDDGGTDAELVVDTLASIGGAATHLNGGRYFGFVTGGATPAALAADWLVSAWDQNAWSESTSPLNAHLEGIAVRWMLDILNLRRDGDGEEGANASVRGVLCGGCSPGNTIALCTARDSVRASRSGGACKQTGCSAHRRFR